MCTVQNLLCPPSSLPSRAHSSKEAPFPTSPSIVAAIFHENGHGRSCVLRDRVLDIWAKGTHTTRIYDHVQSIGLEAVKEEAHKGRDGRST
jgi:hypothetical protein